MRNKYSKLVEDIDKQEEIAEQKDNLAEQLSLVTDNVNEVKYILNTLVKVIGDMHDITKAVTAASKSADNAANTITQAIIDSRKVVITSKLDDKTVRQLQSKYFELSQKEAELFKKHHDSIAKMLEQNKDRCYEIINEGDGVYFGRKTFFRLYFTFCICFGIILLEIVYGLTKLFGL